MTTAITVEKRDHKGQTVLEYPGEILERTTTMVCLRAVFELEESDLGFVVFRQGDVFIEWFFSDRWYNIFQIQEGNTSRLKGWYCNITRPASISEQHVTADDLALDLFIFPNGKTVLLDEDEFRALDIPAHERMAALRAIQTLQQEVSARKQPFDQIR